MTLEGFLGSDKLLMNLKMHIYGLYDYISSFVMLLIKLVVLFHALQRIFWEIIICTQVQLSPTKTKPLACKEQSLFAIQINLYSDNSITSQFERFMHFIGLFCS